VNYAISYITIGLILIEAPTFTVTMKSTETQKEISLPLLKERNTYHSSSFFQKIQQKDCNSKQQKQVNCKSSKKKK